MNAANDRAVVACRHMLEEARLVLNLFCLYVVKVSRHCCNRQRQRTRHVLGKASKVLLRQKETRHEAYKQIVLGSGARCQAFPSSLTHVFKTLKNLIAFFFIDVVFWV